MRKSNEVTDPKLPEMIYVGGAGVQSYHSVIHLPRNLVPG